MKKHLLVFIIGLATFAPAWAQSAANTRVDRLRADVTYLASDELGGRMTGTTGTEKAAAYIRREFQRLKLEAGSKDYLQPFPFVAGVTLGKGNSLSFKNLDGTGKPSAFTLADDWLPLGFSPNAAIKDAPLVFVGHGIVAADLPRDDYANLDATGKIVVAMTGAPSDGKNYGRYADARWKAIAAKNKGAQALILLSAEPNLKDSQQTRLRYDNAGEAGLPVIVLAQDAAHRFLKASGLQGAPETVVAKIAASLTVNLVRQTVQAKNIIGILRGNDPKLRDEAIIIGAHYDHLGLGGEGSGSLAVNSRDIHHGADDNASGTSGLLELARTFAAERQKLRRTVVFIAFSGEEAGLLGSAYYVTQPAWPLTQTVAMFNMDMIGRMRDKNLTVGGVGTAREWKGFIEAANIAQAARVVLGQPETSLKPTEQVMSHGADGQPVIAHDAAKSFNLSLSEDGFGPSDHSSFYGKQIPVLFFFTGAHEDYHKPSDTADKINYDGQARILDFVARLMWAVDAADARPAYQLAQSSAAGRRNMSFNVTLGVMPGYAESNDGLKLDGVREGSPAAQAGLQTGDKVIKLGTFDIRNVQDYTYALGQLKANQEYDIVFVRGTETFTRKITPAARKQ